MRVARLVVCLVTFASALGACTGDTAEPAQGVSAVPYSGGLLRVGMTAPVFFDLDPQAEWSFASWSILRGLLVRTLMSYEASSGTTGSEPKPDLAAAPPEVSSDGMTWTFHLRPGVRYAPPLQDVEVTSPDIVRAILRAGDPDAANPGLGAGYLTSIEGYDDYANGKTDSISGLRAPDPLTLVIRETHPDSSLPYDLALPTTAPIPPSPVDASARLGVATGHDRSADPSKRDGYGPYIVSSGPYMIEGADRIDFTRPAAEQQPAEGLVPWTYDENYQQLSAGSISVVPNPSWDPTTDPERLALPERIILEGGDGEALFRRVASGDLALVFDDSPPAAMLQKYLDDPSLRESVHSIDSGNIVVATFNLAQPPFDDLAMRRAVADALDRKRVNRAVARAMFGQIVLANHYASDVTEDSLASGWSAFPTPDGSPDFTAAKGWLASSPYAENGRCVDPSCRSVTVLLLPDIASEAGGIARNLARLGIRAKVIVSNDFYAEKGSCLDPSLHVGLCVGDGWSPDTPSPGNGLITFFGGPGVSPIPTVTHMGVDAAELARLGSPVDMVPSVDAQIAACNQQVGASSIVCWTRLDQYLVSQLMPSVPLAFQQVTRITDPSIQGFTWDLGVQLPVLDRLVSTAG